MYPFTSHSNQHVALWGDSLSSQIHPYVKAVVEPEVFNCGIGGDTSTGILARMRVAPPEQVAVDYMTIWAGRNDFSTPSTVLANIASMVALAPPNYLVISVLNGSTEPSGSLGYTQILSINASLAATYGNRYWDARSFLVANHDQSAQDLTDFANDVPPTSLRSDAIHLNAAGYTLVAPQIKSRLGL